jgi:hypothetical protein
MLLALAKNPLGAVFAVVLAVEVGFVCLAALSVAAFTALGASLTLAIRGALEDAGGSPLGPEPEPEPLALPEPWSIDDCF